MRIIIIFLATALLVACATKHPVPVDSLATPGSVVETLSSTVLVSFRTEARSITARGMLVYKRPDQFRLVILSPFGTTLFEALLKGDEITMLYPATGVAFKGSFRELPVKTGLKGWGMMKWVLDSDPPVGALSDSVVDRKLPSGPGNERLVIKNGLITEKSLPGGEIVTYRNHTIMAGVRVPLELLLEGGDGERIKIVLEDPEVNRPLSEQAFFLRLDGVQMMPLAELKGM